MKGGVIFDVHGVGVGIRALRPELLDAARELLGHFPEGSTASVFLDFPPDPPPMLSLDGTREEFEFEGLKCWRLENFFVFSDGTSWIAGDPARGRLEGSVSDETASKPRFLSHVFLQIPIVEALRGRGLFHLHASGVDIGGRALLMAGNAGCGKTSLAVALALEGLDYISDDAVLLRERPDGVEVLSWLREFHLSVEMAPSFPEIASVIQKGKTYRPGPKRSFDPSEAFGREGKPRSRAGWLLLPQIGRGRTELLPLPPAEALAGLIRLSPLVFIDPRLAGRHLSALKRLAESCPAFRLRLGEDFLESPRKVASHVLKEVVAAR